VSGFGAGGAVRIRPMALINYPSAGGDPSTWAGKMKVHGVTLRRIKSATDIGLEAAADVTKNIGFGPPQIEVLYNYDGSDKDGQLPKTPQFKIITAAGVALTAGVTWTYTVTEGTVNGFTSASGAQAMAGAGTGTLTLTSLGTATATIEIKGVVAGRTYVMPVRLAKKFDPPPASGGGGSGGTSASDSSLSNVGSTTWSAISNELTITIATGATTAALSASGLALTPIASGSIGSWNVEMKWQRNVSGTWTDIGSTANSDPDPFLESESGIYYPQEGAITCGATDTSLTGGASYTYRLVGRLSSGTKTIYVAGTASAVG
jgi:hypothetical protein